MPCIIGYRCDDEQRCYIPAFGKRSKTDECVPLTVRNVFGKDDRVSVTSTAYPWKAIGKLSTGCTGTLVGRDLVLTAAHCVIDSETYELYANIYFYANMINGKSNHKARVTYVWWGTTQPDDNRPADWALLRLDTKLGDIQGWLGTKTISIDTMRNTQGILVGYSTNFDNGQTAGVVVNCRIIEQLQPNLFLHDCDTGRGSSGGPIFAYWDNKPYIYVLNVGEYRNGGDKSLYLYDYSEKNANIAIWSNALANKINELIRS